MFVSCQETSMVISEVKKRSYSLTNKVFGATSVIFQKISSRMLVNYYSVLKS